MKKWKVVLFIAVLLGMNSLAEGSLTGLTDRQLANPPIQTYDATLDPGNGGNGCSQYNQTVHGPWQDWYENNYRGWAKMTCYAGTAAGAVIVASATGVVQQQQQWQQPQHH